MILKKLGIDIVHGCQLRCVGCPNSLLRPKIKYCDPEVFERMLKNINVKVKILRLYNFGEPMLHPQLDEIVKIIGKSSVNPEQVDITTNGQYWNGPLFEKVFKQKIVTHLYISCDGDGTKREYERLRPPSTWETFLSFIESMKTMRDRLCPKMHLGTRTITDNKKRWKKILLPVGYSPEFRKWTTRINTSRTPWEKRRIPSGLCKYVKSHELMYVDYDGTVVPCCVHPNANISDGFVLYSNNGNLLKEKAGNIIKRRKTTLFYKHLKSMRRTLDVCGKCTKT